MSIWNASFWKDTAERAIATFLQASLGLVVVDAAAPIWELDWIHIAGVGVSAGMLSIAKSVIAGLSNGTPSVGDVEVGKPKDLYDPIEDGGKL